MAARRVALHFLSLKCRHAPAAAVTLLLLALPCCATWQNPGDATLPPYHVGPAGYLRDYADFVTSDRITQSLLNARNAVPALALATGTGLAASGADQSWEQRLYEHPILAPNDPATTGRLSDLGMYTLIAAPFAVPQLFPPEGGVPRMAYLATAVDASLVTFALTQATKTLVGRERPQGGSSDSFVSGHTSAAFMGATLLYREYGWKAGLPAFLAASAVGLWRVESGHHYPGDVLAGAGLGMLIANLVYDKNLGSNGLYRKGPKWMITPIVEPARVGVGVTFRW